MEPNKESPNLPQSLPNNPGTEITPAQEQELEANIQQAFNSGQINLKSIFGSAMEAFSEFKKEDKPLTIAGLVARTISKEAKKGNVQLPGTNSQTTNQLTDGKNS